jgi:hypothetical protein
MGIARPQKSPDPAFCGTRAISLAFNCKVIRKSLLILFSLSPRTRFLPAVNCGSLRHGQKNFANYTSSGKIVKGIFQAFRITHSSQSVGCSPGIFVVQIYDGASGGKRSNLTIIRIPGPNWGCSSNGRNAKLSQGLMISG